MRKQDVMDVFGDEINCIANTQIKNKLVSLLQILPTEFWWISASRRHHPVDERGMCGGLIHAKRTARVAIDLCQAYDLNQSDKDLVIAACLLHDGLNCQQTPNTASHDKLMYEWLAHAAPDDCEWGAIRDYIKRHMGPWGWEHNTGWAYKSCRIMIINTADYIASREWAISIDIWEPIHV